MRSKPVGRLRSVGGGVGGSSNFGGNTAGGEDTDIEGGTMGERGIRGEKGTVNGSVASWSLLIMILLVLRDGLGAINGNEDILWKDGASFVVPGLDALKPVSLSVVVAVDGSVGRDMPGNSVSSLSSSSTSTGGSKAPGCLSDEVGENTAASACACSPARSIDSLWNAISVWIVSSSTSDGFISSCSSSSSTSSTNANGFFNNEYRGDVDRRPFGECFQLDGKESNEKRAEVIEVAVVGRL